MIILNSWDRRDLADPDRPRRQVDFGYDIREFGAIDPLHGSMADYTALLIGETYLTNIDAMARRMAARDELHQPMNMLIGFGADARYPTYGAGRPCS